MKFFRLLKSDFQRAVFSYGFLFSVLAVTFLVVTTGYSWFAEDVWFAQSIPFLLRISLRGNGSGMLILCIVPLIPFSTSFASEWKEKAYLFYISKVGPERYIISKMVISALSGFLVLLIGVSLSIPIFHFLAPQAPFTPANDIPADFVINLWSQGSYFLGYVAFLVNYALCACFTTVCAVWFSVYIPNYLATLAAPLLINFTIIRVDTLAAYDGIFAKVPFFNPTFWLNADYDTTSAAVNFAMRLGNIAMISLVLGFFAIRKTKRRVLNG